MHSLLPKLEYQVSKLKDELPALLKTLGGVGAVMVGSCSRGEATYRSDLDLLVVMGAGSIKYTSVQKWRKLKLNFLHPHKCHSPFK